MTTRIAKRKNKDGSVREYLQIIESYRPKGKHPTQRVLATLGRVDELKDGSVDHIILGLVKFSARLQAMDAQEDLFLRDCVELGVRTVVDALWKKVGLNRIFERLDLPASVAEAVKLMVTARLDEPLSKRGTHRAAHNWQLPEDHAHSLSTLYRALDRIQPHTEEIENEMFRLQHGLSDQTELFDRTDLDVVFFDTTSVKLKSAQVGGLFRYGYSKDHRPDLPQFMVGVVMTAAGDAVAQYVFPGNTADTNAFLTAVENLRQRFPFRRVILVADSGCVGADVLEELRRRRFEYVVAARLRVEKALQENLLSIKGNFRKYDDVLGYKAADINGERCVLVRNKELARYDAERRESILTWLREREGQSVKQLVGNRGFKRFLAKSGAVAVDESKVRADARFDGRWVIRTNAKDLSDTDVIEAYKGQWQVEKWFSQLKHLVDVGPVRHWTEKRVRAHVFVCFLALKLHCIFRRGVQDRDPTAELPQVWDDLKRLKATVVDIPGMELFIRNDLHGQAELAFRASGAAVPHRVRILRRDVGTTSQG